MRADARYQLVILLSVWAACQWAASCGGGDGESTDLDTGAYSDTDTDADADMDTDTDVDEDWIGLPCDGADQSESDAVCTEASGNPDAFCLVTSELGGFCTMDCTPAEETTAGVNPCAEGGENTACSDFSWLLADEPQPLCVETCTPSSSDNPCTAEYLACSPLAWSFEAATSTCLLPACQGDEDCPVPVGTTCAGDADCDEAAGEYCIEEEGRCFFDGTCDTTTGRCFHVAGDASAVVGDPCETAWECGANQECLPPLNDADTNFKDVRANGYCSLSGCAVTMINSPLGSTSNDPGVQDEFGCGASGACVAGYYGGGLCHRRCNLPEDDVESIFSCRQEAWGDDEVLDVDGEYDCHDQTAFIVPAYQIGPYQVVNGFTFVEFPFCTWIGPGQACMDGMMPAPNDAYTCEYGYGSYISGSSLASWGTGMECRDDATGDVVQDGYCMDLTTSGAAPCWGEGPCDTDAYCGTAHEVRQPSTSLCWRRCPLGQTWSGNTCQGEEIEEDWCDATGEDLIGCDPEDAGTGICEELLGEGYRLPDKEELEELLDGEPCTGATICAEMFDPAGGRYWSSTHYDDYLACFADFEDGYVGFSDVNGSIPVRCLREVQ